MVHGENCLSSLLKGREAASALKMWMDGRKLTSVFRPIRIHDGNVPRSRPTGGHQKEGLSVFVCQQGPSFYRVWSACQTAKGDVHWSRVLPHTAAPK